MVGIFDVFSEDVRAADAARYTGTLGVDDRYWNDFAFAFQLHTPTGAQMFTLVLNPERYSKTHPFSKETTVAQDGGVVVERQGVIISQLVIGGHTGVSPRLNADVPVPLSGQAHLLRLERECFLRYGALVQDPHNAEKVYLTFHNFRDNEHWIVEPSTWKVDRTKERRLHYPYEITLDILGPAETLVPKGAEDDPVLAGVQDAALSVKRAVVAIETTLADLAAAPEAARAAMQTALSDATLGTLPAVSLADLDEAANSLTRIAGAASEFVRGIKSAIGIPYRTIQDVREGLEQIADVLSQVAGLPADVVQAYRRTVDALDAIGAYPEKFVEPFPAAASRFLDLVQGPAGETQADLDAAAAAESQALTGSTGLRSTDAARVAAGLFVTGSAFPAYQGFAEYVVQLGDTLASIAAAMLGDARRWIDIALTNALRAPYISVAGLPGTVFPGDRILIPQLSAGTPLATVRASGFGDLGETQYETLLGRDLMLEDVADRAVDWVVDTAAGATDFKQVAGVPNVVQALKTICETERGTNILFAQLGTKRLVGRPGTFDRLAEGQLVLSEAILRDPRAERIRSMRFTAERDSVAVDIEVDLIQQIQLRTITRIPT